MSRIQASLSGRSTSSMSGPSRARAPSVWPGPATTVTGSKRRTARATAAQARRASASVSPPSSPKVKLGPGQAIQVRSCRAHSGGMRKPSAAGVFMRGSSRVAVTVGVGVAE